MRYYVELSISVPFEKKSSLRHIQLKKEKEKIKRQVAQQSIYYNLATYLISHMYVYACTYMCVLICTCMCMYV